MQKFFTWLGGVIAIGSLAVLGWIVIKMFSWFSEAKADVKLSIVSAALTALAAIVTVLIAKKKEKEADFQRAQYQDKLSTYQQFVENVIAKLFLNAPQKFKNEKEKKQFEEKKLATQIRGIQDFTKNAILWGDGSVIHETSLWLNIIRNQDSPDVIAAMKQIEPVLKAIREDLGHSNKKIAEGDILRLFIVDYDETLAKGRLTTEDDNSATGNAGEKI